MGKITTDKDKKYNVWIIMNENGKFYNLPYNSKLKQTGAVQWVDNIHAASAYNHKNATAISESIGLKNLTIVKVS